MLAEKTTIIADEKLIDRKTKTKNEEAPEKVNS